MVQIEGLPSQTTLEQVQHIRDDLDAIRKKLEAASLIDIKAAERVWPFHSISIGTVLLQIEACRATLAALEKEVASVTATLHHACGEDW